MFKLEIARVEKITNDIYIDPAMIYLAVINRISLEEMLIGDHQRCALRLHFIPCEGNITLRFEYSSKFDSGKCSIEPVKCLPGSYEINAVGRQRRFLGSPGNAAKLWKVLE